MREERGAFLCCFPVRFNLLLYSIERGFLVRGFPLTPRPPTPHKFGFSLVEVADLLVRICGERGEPLCFLLASLSEVSAIELAALATKPSAKKTLKCFFPLWGW